MEILNLNNIQKSFGEKHIHTGVTFGLQQGEMLGLLGGSGTGKSVLLRSIIGLEYIDGGEIVFRGDRIDTLSEPELKPYRIKISYSFQSGALFDSLNVFENIAYPLFEHTQLNITEIEQKVGSILKLVDMSGSEKLMPSDLSGGMQKRVGMARAMIMEPEIILYDEPTAGLDPTNTLNTLKIMEQHKEHGMSGIFVTHDIPSALKVCDRILILDKGIIGFSGTPTELIESDNPIVKKYFLNMG